MTRAFSVAGLLLIGLFLPWWGWVLASFLYAFWYSGLEVVVFGALLDAYFGYNGGVPVFLLISTCTFLVAVGARPHISV